MWRHIKQILQVIVLLTAMLVSCTHGTVLGKAIKKKCFVTFYLVQTTLSNFNQVIRISANTLIWNFKSFHKIGKFKRFLMFSSIPSCTKWNQEMLQYHSHISDYHDVQTLYCEHYEMSSFCLLYDLH